MSIEKDVLVGVALVAAFFYLTSSASAAGSRSSGNNSTAPGGQGIIPGSPGATGTPNPSGSGGGFPGSQADCPPGTTFNPYNYNGPTDSFYNTCDLPMNF